MMLNLGSGLNPDVSIHMGKTLALSLENGWGWYLKKHDHSTEFGYGLFYEKELSFKAFSFLNHAGVIRCVFGDIELDNQRVFGKKLLAVALSDGLDYDFERNLCSVWRLFLGEFDYSFSEQAELCCAGDGILGWGRNLHLLKT